MFDSFSLRQYILFIHGDCLGLNNDQEWKVRFGMRHWVHIVDRRAVPLSYMTCVASTRAARAWHHAQELVQWFPQSSDPGSELE